MRRLVRGFHGTSRNAARAIESSGFDLRRGKGNWLGCGACFWEEDEARARIYAEKHHAESPCTIVAQLDLSDGGLDLVQQAERARFRLYAEQLLKDEEIRAELPADGWVDAVLLDTLFEAEPFGWVRAVVHVAESVYASVEPWSTISMPTGLRSRIVRDTCVQIVVRRTEHIVAIMLLP
jgi:hypothetical protein